MPSYRLRGCRCGWSERGAVARHGRAREATHRSLVSVAVVLLQSDPQFSRQAVF